MSSDWAEVPVSEIAEGIYDGPHATPKKTTSGPVFLGISSLVSGRIDLSQSAHVSEEDFVRWTRRVTPRPGDLVFSYETRIGEAALIPEGLRCCLGRRMGLIRPDTSKIDPRFLIFAFLGPPFQETLRQRTIHGSTVDRILLTEFPQFPIRLPLNIDEQRRIAAVLGALDDKIELNRRMNRTLEEIAQAIFKSWFMDFDGVPKSERLGDRFPAGWEATTLADHVSLQRGTTYKSGLLGQPGPLLLGLASIQRNGGFRRDKLQTYGGNSPESITVEPGGIYVSLKDVTQSADLLGAVARLPSYLERGRLTQDTVRLVFVPKAAPPAYVYWLLRTPEYRDYCRGRATGTTNLGLSRSDFLSYPVPVPPPPLMRQFVEVEAALTGRMDLNDRQGDTLRVLRDALLPKLISGEIRVQEAEEAVGAVA